MNYRYIAIIIAAVIPLTLTACTDQPPEGGGLGCNSDLTNINIDVISSAENFGDLVTLDKTIELETTDESVIGAVSIVRQHPAGFVILDTRVTHQAYLFDLDGGFVGRLGSRGDGSNEYQELADARISPSGDIYLLSRARRKLLKYSSEGDYVGDMSFMDLGFAPSRFEIVSSDPFTVAFYVLHPDFVFKKHKVVVATYVNNQFEYTRSFVRQEDAGKRMFFSGGGFNYVNNTLWIHPIFDIYTDIYDPATGERIGRTVPVTSVLPAPYISNDLFSDFNSTRDAIPAYANITRLVSQEYLGGLLMSFYTSGQNGAKHLRFHSLCGELLPIQIDDEAFPLLYRLRGISIDRNSIIIVDDITDSDPGTEDYDDNPSISLYRLRWVRGEESLMNQAQSPPI